jgi:hypothetical protein
MSVLLTIAPLPAIPFCLSQLGINQVFALRRSAHRVRGGGADPRSGSGEIAVPIDYAIVGVILQLSGK